MKKRSSSKGFPAHAFGQRIIEIRLSKGLSQAQVAGKSKKKPQSLERVENGKVNPTINYLFAIAQAMEVPVKELIPF